MISTGTLMLLKALLTATVLLGLCIQQLLALRRLRCEREARRAEPDSAEPSDSVRVPADMSRPNCASERTTKGAKSAEVRALPDKRG